MADVGTNTPERDTFDLEEDNQLLTEGFLNLTSVFDMQYT